jgi:hypothetical protein
MNPSALNLRIERGFFQGSVSRNSMWASPDDGILAEGVVVLGTDKAARE